jgi:adenine-specific DNA-methyltransferase
MQTFHKQDFIRKLRPLTAMVKANKRASHRLLDTLIVEWTKGNYPNVSCKGFAHGPLYARRPAVLAFVQWLSSLSFLEATYWLSSVYALWAGDEHRKKFAVFFTPPSLTKRLLDDLAEAGVSFSSGTFIDPACGGAAFLAPIAERVRDELKLLGKSDSEIILHIVSHIYGADIDEQLCRLSRHFMRIVLRDEIASTGIDPEFRISRADSLVELAPLHGTFSAVVSNPPYRKMSADEVLATGGLYAGVTQAQPNLYGLFIALSVKLLNSSGHAALVTPTSFLTGQNFSKLRKFLAEECQVQRIGMVSDRRGIFIDVEQETSLTILRRQSVAMVSAEKTQVSVVARDGSYRSVGTCELSSEGSAWLIPRSETDVDLLSKGQASPYRITDFGYRIRIGTFVWNRDQRPTHFEDDYQEIEKTSSTVPLLWSRDISTGGVLKYLKNSKTPTEPQWVDLGDLANDAVIKNPSVVLQRVTSNDQPKRLVGAVVSANFLKKYKGFVAENHVVVLEQVVSDPVLPPKHLVTLLGCAPIDRLFRCLSGSTNVSAYELNQLPMPNPCAAKAAMQFNEDLPSLIVHGFQSAQDVAPQLVDKTHINVMQ